MIIPALADLITSIYPKKISARQTNAKKHRIHPGNPKNPINPGSDNISKA
jgi:hypothetical protein